MLQVSPLLTSFLVQVASALQEWVMDDAGISKKSHINYHWPSYRILSWFVPFDLEQSLPHPPWYTLTPAQVLSSRISPLPSSVYVPALAQVLTFGFSPLPSSSMMNGLHLCGARGLILAWLHVFVNLFGASFALMLTSM